MGEQAARSTEPRWDGIVRRQIDFEHRALDEESRSVEVIASSETIDSHGDIVEQDWDLKRFKKNPVVLWNHNRAWEGGAEPKDMLPIGFAANTKVVAGKLESKLTFVDEKANEMAEKVWQGFRQGSLRAVSVGFRPGEVTQELRPDGRTIFRLKKCELREISVVPMGSNPDAVSKSIGEQERAWLTEMAKSTDAAPAPRAVAPAERSSENTDSPAAKAEKEDQMDLKELQAAYEKAVNELATANATIATLKGKAAEDNAAAQTKFASTESLLTATTGERDAARKELESEKKLTAKLEAELKAANEQLAKADAAVAKSELDARNAKKFAPCEREELDALVKDIGLPRVLKLLDARADLPITTPVTVDGKPVGEKAQGAPPPAAPEEPTDPSADLLKAASDAAEKAYPEHARELSHSTPAGFEGLR